MAKEERSKTSPILAAETRRGRGSAGAQDRIKERVLRGSKFGRYVPETNECPEAGF